MKVYDVQRLGTFLEIVRRGSVSAAAVALGYTQSAVSQQLATLERDVGLTLVDRGRRPLRPTLAGAALLPEVEALLARATALGAAIEELRGLRRGSVELVAFASALIGLVPPVVAGFRDAHPGLVVRVREAETEQALALLRAGAADVAVIHLMPGQELRDGDDLVRAGLGDDPLDVVLPVDHPLAAHSSVPLDALAAAALVVPRAGGAGAPFRRLVERLLAELGREPHVAYEVDDLRGAQAFAGAGLGIALMHRLTLGSLPPGAVARPLDPPVGARRVEVARLAGRRVPAALALFDGLAERGLAAAPAL